MRYSLIYLIVLIFTFLVILDNSGFPLYYHHDEKFCPIFCKDIECSSYGAEQKTCCIRYSDYDSHNNIVHCKHMLGYFFRKNDYYSSMRYPTFLEQIGSVFGFSVVVYSLLVGGFNLFFFIWSIYHWITVKVTKRLYLTLEDFERDLKNARRISTVHFVNGVLIILIVLLLVITENIISSCVEINGYNCPVHRNIQFISNLSKKFFGY